MEHSLNELCSVEVNKGVDDEAFDLELLAFRANYVARSLLKEIFHKGTKYFHGANSAGVDVFRTV